MFRVSTDRPIRPISGDDGYGACVDVQGGRDLDIVLVGATGYVGRLVAEHLARVAPPDARVALAGRDPERVRSVLTGLDRPAWEVLRLDTTDKDQATQVCRRTRVVITTVGPYNSYGNTLVDACAAEGTHCADLSGEVLFVAGNIQRNHEIAQRSGARIVHSCGFDSVPSDLGMFLVDHQAQQAGAGTPVQARMYVLDTRGGISGGTIASALGQLEQCRDDAHARRVVMDPLALVRPTPGGSPERLRPGRLAANLLRHDDDGPGWVTPFFMAPYNTRIVQRSHALRHGMAEESAAPLNDPVPALDYSEVVLGGTGPLGAARAGLVGAASVAGLALLTKGGALRDRLPRPGSGPSAARRQAGRYTTVTVGTTADGRRFRAEFADHRDPGYGSTAVMLGQAGLALAFDALPDEPGVTTPAAAMGHRLVERLREQGFRIEAGPHRPGHGR